MSGAPRLVAGLAVAALALVRPVDAGSPAAARGGVPAIVDRALPAVVSVITRQIERDQFNQRVRTRGLGSGFVVDRRGYLLTSLHVVEGAEDIKVTLTDGRSFRASFVGGDRFSELAVLKIDAPDLPVLALGDARRLAIGETVVTVGNPLWLEGGPTVTVGVVSALGRSMEEEGLPALHDLIQTDAAINPGNSGGPLLNLRGEVVGINTAMIASAHGISFAVSSTTARPVLRALIATGGIVRPSIGVYAVSLTPQVAYANDLAIERGALVIRVDAGGPAEGAGVRPGDVIVAVDGQAVGDLHGFHDRLAAHRLGDRVDLRVWRDGQTLTLVPEVKEQR